MYKCFACEELSITLSLYIEGAISAKTLKNVKKSYQSLVVDFYQQFNIMNFPCSYDLTGFNDAMGIFFNKYKILFLAYIKLPVFLFNYFYNKSKQKIKKTSFGKWIIKKKKK